MKSPLTLGPELQYMLKPVIARLPPENKALALPLLYALHALETPGQLPPLSDKLKKALLQWFRGAAARMHTPEVVAAFVDHVYSLGPDEARSLAIACRQGPPPGGKLAKVLSINRANGKEAEATVHSVVGSLLGISEKSVKTLYADAKKKLRHAERSEKA